MAGIDINRTTDGIDLPPAVSNEIWGALVEESAVMRAARRITLPGRGVSIPLITGDAEAAWVDETDEKPVSRPTLSNKTMTPYTLAVIVPFSNQFRRDLPGLYAELARRLPFSLGKKFDETVYGGTAPGDNFDTLTTAPTKELSADDPFGSLNEALVDVATAGGDLTAWIATPALHGTLLGARDVLGRQFFVSDPANQRTVGSVFGAPVYKTRGDMGDSIGIAGDWAGSAVYGTVEGVQVSISDQATLTDGETTLNLWQRNMFAVRAEIEVGFRVRDVNHFVGIQAPAPAGG